MPSSRAASNSGCVAGEGICALEECVDLVLPLEVPARKEGRERELGIDDEVAAVRAGLPQEREQPRHDLPARLGAGDRAELRGADGDDA